MVSRGEKTATDAARLFKIHPSTVSRLLFKAVSADPEIAPRSAFLLLTTPPFRRWGQHYALRHALNTEGWQRLLSTPVDSTTPLHTAVYTPPLGN
jgi:hypothetical protein